MSRRSGVPFVFLTAIWLLLALPSCGDDDDDGPGTDAGDTERDVREDTRPDPVIDPVVDPVVDPVTDPVSDTVTDTATDVVTDAEVGPEACEDKGSVVGGASTPSWTGTNAAAADDFEGSCTYPWTGGKDVCFDWSSPGTGWYAFATFDSEFDTVLYAFDEGGTEVACNDDMTATYTDSWIFLEFDEIGEDITGVVDGWHYNEVGTYDVYVIGPLGEFTTCEAGNTIANTALPVLVTVDEADATTDASWQGTCFTEWCQEGVGVDYCFTAPHTGGYVFDTYSGAASTTADTAMVILDGWQALDCNDDIDPSSDWQSMTGAWLEAGQQVSVHIEFCDYNSDSQVDLNVWALPLVETTCANWYDDDLDGLMDCADPTDCGGGTPNAACVAGSGATGTACTANTNCAASGGDPACLPESFGWPAGYCSEWCTLGQPSTCDTAGTTCVDVDDPMGRGLCMKNCATTANCRTETNGGYAYVCGNPTGTTQFVCGPDWWFPENCEDDIDNSGDGDVDCDDVQCQVYCATELDCADWSDNDVDGQPDCADVDDCQGTATCVPGAGASGTPCTAAIGCSAVGNDPNCFTEDRYWPGGYCAEYCNPDAATPCPSGALCVPFEGGVTYCLDICTDVNQCRTTTMLDPDGATIAYACSDAGFLTSSVCIPDWIVQ